MCSWLDLVQLRFSKDMPILNVANLHRFCNFPLLLHFSLKIWWTCSIVTCCAYLKIIKWNIISTMVCLGLRWEKKLFTNSWPRSSFVFSVVFHMHGFSLIFILFSVSVVICCRGWERKDCGICTGKNVRKTLRVSSDWDTSDIMVWKVALMMCKT